MEWFLNIHIYFWKEINIFFATQKPLLPLKVNIYSVTWKVPRRFWFSSFQSDITPTWVQNLMLSLKVNICSDTWKAPRRFWFYSVQSDTTPTWVHNPLLPPKVNICSDTWEAPRRIESGVWFLIRYHPYHGPKPFFASWLLNYIFTWRRTWQDREAATVSIKQVKQHWERLVLGWVTRVMFFGIG